MMFDHSNKLVKINIPSRVLVSIFDECDHYNQDETGGRIVGTFRDSLDGSLEINVSGVIEAGPKAKRSNSSLFQDRDYQANMFRRIERLHPDIEHLGSWHTHHVNGFPTLSSGDIQTYRRIVNHEQHNHNFFYALLVVARLYQNQALMRYKIKHYILYRGDEHITEVEPDDVTITDDSILWPIDDESKSSSEMVAYSASMRAKDNLIIPELFPKIQPYWSKIADALYWKGPLKLIDNSSVEIMIPEISDTSEEQLSSYRVIVKNVPENLSHVIEAFSQRQFDSAAQAAIALEKELNHILYQIAKQRST